MKVINLRIIFYTLLCQINWYRQICGLKLWFDFKTFIQLIKLHNDIEKKQKWIEEKSYNQVGKKEKTQRTKKWKWFRLCSLILMTCFQYPQA